MTGRVLALAGGVLGFFPWHFLLRRAGLRLPTRQSARIYVALALPAVVARAIGPFAALVSAAGSVVWLRRSLATSRAPAGQRGTRAHFDALAPDYADQLSPTARRRVVERKTALMADALAAAGIHPPARLLDAGCGHGWYVDSLASGGFSVTGADLSPQQLEAARHLVQAHRHTAALTAASILALPVRGAPYDGAFAVNVLHHLDRPAQTKALEELARAVRLGGLVFLHEINTVNPLYRFYMSYVFPLWKRIDLGTEDWLDPRHLPAAAGLRLERIHYYTFLPDFTPPALYRQLAPLEARLERSALAPWSAHFTAVYRRPPAP